MIAGVIVFYFWIIYGFSIISFLGVSLDSWLLSLFLSPNLYYLNFSSNAYLSNSPLS